MEKRYQVFVSSTFVGLQEERAIIFKTLMELGHLPAGMEFFPAMDEEQMEFIKKIIDESDYYLLIIGGRYGSLSATGLGYTEMEFDYAVGKGRKVLALVHDKPNEIPAGHTELDPDGRQKLEAFRAKVQKGRLVKYWNQAEQLAGLVAVSLPAVIRAHPAEGWVRGAAAASVEILSEINELRKENAELKAKLVLLEAAEFDLPGLQQLDSTVFITGQWRYRVSGTGVSEEVGKFAFNSTWREIFLCLSGPLWRGIIHDALGSELAKTDKFKELIKASIAEPSSVQRLILALVISEPKTEQLQIHFRAWKLIEQWGDSWRLTRKGEQLHIAALAEQGQNAP